MAILSEEQTMLRDMARDWAKEKSPVSAFRALRDSGSSTGFDPQTYQQMAEMGWSGVIIPEAYGGSEFGYLGFGLVLEETGRTLTASPLLSSALGAASALILAGTETQKEAWLPNIASGATIGTLAIDESEHHDPEKIETTATPDGDGWVINGRKAFVAEGDAADLFVTAAKTSKGVALFLIPGDAAGIERENRKMADSRSHADITFTNVKLPAEGLLGDEDGKALLEKVLDRVRIGTAAEMLGLSQQAFDTTLDYLKTREQFGEIIARFQALQHRMAKLFTEIELTRSTVEAALQALDQDRSDVPVMASLAKAVANETTHLMSREMIQLHGGIGMTDDYEAGFYLKRARVLEQMYGNASFHRERFAKLNGY